MKGKVVVSILACAATAVIAFPATAMARTQLVWAGGRPSFQSTLLHFGAEANDFFPHSVTIAQGDTIEWQGMSIGFHSIDLPGKAGGDFPLFIPTGSTASGLKDAAGKPFWFNGQPNLGINPALFAPSGGNSYDGSARVDAGLPFGPPTPFKVTFTKPGTYAYVCDLHYDMRGIVVVRPTGAKTPSAAQDAAAVTKQQTRDAKTAKALAKTKVTGHRISVGVAGKNGVEILGMFPTTLHVHKGTTVTFAMATLTGETHTTTFGPAGYLNPLVQAFNTNTPVATAFYPSSPPTSGPIPVPGSHGKGFASSGALDHDSGTPLPATKKFKFTKPGTYHYECLIHPVMQGTIIVK
jgi:plastocyanin